MSLFAVPLCGCLQAVVGGRSLRRTAHHRKDGWLRSTLVLVAMMAGGLGAASPAQAQDSGWLEFSGTWTAAGRRQDIALGSDRRASVADYSGSLMLHGASRPALGFRAEAVVLNDSATGLTGRAVWTDDADDHVYSELRGESAQKSTQESAQAGNRIVGTFVGGSGRYKGATGTYEFSWRFLLEGEDGIVQGQSTGLTGKVRFPVGPGGTRP